MPHLFFVGERTLSSFTVSDDVNIEYHEGKIMHISLSELLPEYKDTGVIGQIKQSLAIFPETQLSLSISYIANEYRRHC